MSTQSLNLFIVDDNPLMVMGLQKFLENKFADRLIITTYESGERALEKIDRTTNIIILDYYLNTVQKDAANGMEILQTIKKRYPNIHIIMLSSQERYGVAMQTIQKGAEQYIVKDDTAFEKIAAMITEFI
ncbi:MAG: response regulator [Bacteroidia bacterium]